MKSKHTQEPWVASSGDKYIDIVERDKFNSLIAQVRMGGPSGYDQKAIHNARRIVSCVNAMGGIEDPAAFREERDQLLYALKGCVGLIRDLFPVHPVAKLLRDAGLETLEQLIAKAEGKSD